MRGDIGAAQNGRMPDDDELARLQARAYGPDADIDAAGLARLAELRENRAAALAAAGSAPTPDADATADTLAVLFRPGSVDVSTPTRRGLRAGLREADPAPDPAPGPVFESLPLPAPEVDAEEEPDSTGSGVASRMRSLLPAGRMRWAWLASIVVAVVVTALVTAGVVSSDGGDHAATLTPQTDTDSGARTRASLAEQDGSRYFGEYLGLHVYELDSCLEASVGDARRPIWGACAGEGLTPIMDVYVTGANADSGLPVPDAVAERFPEGAVIRFTLRGDTVLVDEGALPSRR